jgi:hypothetical protein
MNLDTPIDENYLIKGYILSKDNNFSILWHSSSDPSSEDEMPELLSRICNLDCLCGFERKP